MCMAIGAFASDFRGFEECPNADKSGYTAIVATCCFDATVQPLEPPLPPEPQCAEITHEGEQCLDKQFLWVLAEVRCREQGMLLQDLLPSGGCASADGNVESFTGFQARCCGETDVLQPDKPTW